MGTLNSETVDALNMLLEDVRASVEIEVALSNGATEFLEREALTVMGVEDTLIACSPARLAGVAQSASDPAHQWYRPPGARPDPL